MEQHLLAGTAQWQRRLQLQGAGLQCGKQRQNPQQRHRLSTGVDRPRQRCTELEPLSKP